MSEKKYAPEPWRMLRDETYHHVVFVSSDAGPFVSGDVDEYNAARIFACVNACAGIEDPEAAIEQARQVLREAVGLQMQPLSSYVKIALEALTPKEKT